jgi:N-acetylglucosaminyldiphosphoundecaprenol N-acetyl-beta-D-mannosaminyltransferase
MSRKVAERRTTSRVIGTNIDVLHCDEALNRIRDWAVKRESHYVCLCNVHSVVTASQDPAFAAALDQADMVAPDGAPVAWMLRKSGYANQSRITGPDLMWAYCEQASAREELIYLYGSAPETLALLQAKLAQYFPGLKVVGAYSPPYRQLTSDERAEVVKNINASGAGTVWVSLGCPKQELWMAEHKGQIKGVMLGVGAAFDFIAGTTRRAPYWMQYRGLEWLYRLASEPRRLWKRYLVTNTLFIFGATRQIVRHRRKG